MANIFKAKSLISRTGVFSNEVIAPNLVYNTGNQNISGIKSFYSRPTVNGTGVLLSGEAASLPTTIVYTTGNQTISGIKTFTNNLEVQGTGIFNALDLSNISEFNFSGTNINLISGNVNISGQIYISGNPVLTGVDLSSYLTSSTASSTYATITNLANTGSSLVSSINSFSGLFTGFTGNLDATYATDIQLLNTGITLNNSINSLSGVSVLTYGNQNISGNKTFINNITVSGTGTFNAIDLDNIDNLSLSGVDVTLTNSNVNVAGNIFISGNPVLTGVDLTPYATIVNLASTGSVLATNLASTGSTLNSSINSLSGLFTGFTGALDATFASDVQLANTGSTLDNKINSLSGTLANDYLTTSSASSTYATITNLALTGSNLQTNINNLSNTYATITNVGLTGATLNSSINSLSGLFTGYTGTLDATYATDLQLLNTGTTLNDNITSLSGLFTGFTGNLDATYATDVQLANTGTTLNTRINNLSGYINSTSSNIVFTTGNQIISGVKTFAQDATFGDTGQGDFLVISGNNFTVYGSGNFTSGLFINGNPVLTGVDLTPYATTSNLALTGSTLDAKINSLSGTLTGDYLTTSSASNTYATISNLNTTGSTLTTNLASTGSTLDTKINNLSGYINSSSSNIVFTTGNQSISGNKTFNNTLYVRTISGFQDSGPDSLNLIAASNLLSVGGNINLTAGTGTTFGFSQQGSINLNGNININNNSSSIGRGINIWKTGTIFGFPTTINALTIDENNISLNTLAEPNRGFGLVISGVLVTPALYATSTNLASTGSILNSNITSLSGLFTGYTGTLDATYATDLQLLNTGITLNTRINNLSGYVNSTSSNIVFTTGNQNIGGNKTFTGVTTFSGQEVNLVDTALNLSGLGDMTFSGTNINFINSPVFISGTNLRVAGDVLGNNLVYNTGSQIISGIKTFATGVNISGDVGIGTITPFAKLHIAGPPALLNTTMEDVLYLQRPFNAGVAFGSRAVLRLGKYTSDGSQSFTRLDIALRSGSDDTTISTPPEINVMTLRADGSVGIGTTTPNERLTVIGNANISGNTTVSGSINISGNYDVYSQIENVKKLAIAYAIAL